MVEHTQRQPRNAAVDALREEVLAEYADSEFDEADIREVLNDELKVEIRRRIVDEGIRPDGRGYTEVRPLYAEIGLSPRAHGSGLFQRGETQVLTIATLGTPRDEQKLDDLYPDETKRYMHHYNFPPYSTGETWPLRGTRRREVGHGALAEAALRPMIPSEEDFPYTIRVVSDIMESNGSSSMASVTGGCLALMDAGVPLKAPVAGIAMGLVKEEDQVVILSDILGDEDHTGDMDFKVTGTADGITALQMDIKIHELSRDIMQSALEQARLGRIFILNKMLETIKAPREEISPYAPTISTIKINPDKIREIIGPGGKIIRGIQSETNTSIEIDDSGAVKIAAFSKEEGDAAIKMVEDLTQEPEIGAIYEGKVVKITDFGAFVQILPGTDGLVHISQLANRRITKVSDVVKEGDPLKVKVLEISRDGKIRLSHKAVLEEKHGRTSR